VVNPESNVVLFLKDLGVVPQKNVIKKKKKKDLGVV